jgi:tetratricopeptide (TPR) repeat protein
MEERRPKKVTSPLARASERGPRDRRAVRNDFRAQIAALVDVASRSHAALGLTERKLREVYKAQAAQANEQHTIPPLQPHTRRAYTRLFFWSDENAKKRLSGKHDPDVKTLQRIRSCLIAIGVCSQDAPIVADKESWIEFVERIIGPSSVREERGQAGDRSSTSAHQTVTAEQIKEAEEAHELGMVLSNSKKPAGAVPFFEKAISIYKKNDSYFDEAKHGFSLLLRLYESRVRDDYNAVRHGRDAVETMFRSAVADDQARLEQIIWLVDFLRFVHPNFLGHLGLHRVLTYTEPSISPKKREALIRSSYLKALAKLPLDGFESELQWGLSLALRGSLKRPTRIAALGSVGKFFERAGRLEEAVAIYREIMSTEEKEYYSSWDWRRALARCLLFIDPTEAEELLLAPIRSNSGGEGILLDLAEFYYLQGRQVEAERWFRKVVTADFGGREMSFSVDRKFEYADVLQELGKHAESQSFWSKGFRELTYANKPTAAVGLMGAALRLKSLSMHQEAREAFYDTLEFVRLGSVTAEWSERVFNKHSKALNLAGAEEEASCLLLAPRPFAVRDGFHD